jgi:hypothetical protein
MNTFVAPNMEISENDTIEKTNLLAVTDIKIRNV